MTYGPLNGQFETYTYDAKNRLTGVAGVTYAYDALGNRITMTEGTNITTFVNTPSALSRLLMTVDDEDNVVYYIYGRGLISEIEGTTERYYHYDSRGNTIALTNDQGAVTDTFTYAPFGEVISRTGAYEPRFQFAGQLGIQKDSNGLYYMRARYYNSDIQRFISRDTYEGMLAKPLTLNYFAYGLNNPFRYVDPSGYDPVRIKGLSDEQKKKAALLNNSHGESDVLSFISSFVPGLGDAKDIQEALTGVDLITNKKLTGLERVVSGVCVLIPIVSAKAGRVVTKSMFKSVDDILLNANPGRATKGKSTLWNKPGGFQQALDDFDSLNVTDIEEIPGGLMGKLPDGRTINVRIGSSDGRPTLEIFDGQRSTKVRYDE